MTAAIARCTNTFALILKRKKSKNVFFIISFFRYIYIYYRTTIFLRYFNSRVQRIYKNIVLGNIGKKVRKKKDNGGRCRRKRQTGKHDQLKNVTDRSRTENEKYKKGNGFSLNVLWSQLHHCACNIFLFFIWMAKLF